MTDHQRKISPNLISIGPMVCDKNTEM